MAGFRVLVVVLVVGVSALAAGSAGASTVYRTFVAPATGNDANDCSRAAPCLTLQRALNQVQAHGTVTVLESGVLGQGATVSKAVTVNVPAGIDAGLARSTGTLLIVNAPTDAVVTINGLTLDGHGSAQTAISYSQGQQLALNRVTITDFSASLSSGVYEAPRANNTHLKLYMNDSFVSGTGGSAYSAAVWVNDSHGGDYTGGTAVASLTNDRLEGNTNGVKVGDAVLGGAGARAQVVHSIITGDGGGYGVQTNSGTNAVVVDSTIAENNIGLEGTWSDAPIFVRHSTITGNNGGVNGYVYTGGDNVLIGNSTDGSFAGPIPLK